MNLFRKRMLGSKGFTLIEILLMVSLLGIMVVLYVESAGNLSDVAIDGASRKTQQDLRYAQQLAQTTGTNYGVNFTANTGYEVYVGSPGHPITDPVTKGNMTENFQKFPGVVLNTTQKIEFDSTGKPVVGGNERIRLTASSGAIRDVYIVANTGAVIVDLLQRGTGCSCELCNDDEI